MFTDSCIGKTHYVSSDLIQMPSSKYNEIFSILLDIFQINCAFILESLRGGLYETEFKGF